MAEKKQWSIGPNSLQHVAPHLTDKQAEKLARELGAAMHRFEPRSGWTPKDASDFIAQCAHESLRFRYPREIWGPTATQSGYWRRRELHGPGPLYPGLGYQTRGAGWIQTTGRVNFRRAAKKLGISYVRLLAVCGSTKYASLLAAAWWQDAFPAGTKGMSVLQVTKRVNGGTNGLDDRQECTALARKVAKHLVPKERVV